MPSNLTEAEFLDTISPVPEYADFYFVNGDSSLGDFAFSRAYLKFRNFEDMVIFKHKFDGYVFVDAKGNEYPCIVEHAPLQKLYRVGDSKQTKVDIKENTIEEDPDFLEFQEMLRKADNESPPIVSFDTLLEEIENRNKHTSEPKMTPLLEYLQKRRLEKLKLKEEKKKKKLEAKKKIDEQKKQKKQQQKSSNNNNKKDKDTPTYVVKVRVKEDKDEAQPPKTAATSTQPTASTSASVKPAAKPTKEQQDGQKKPAEPGKKNGNKEKPRARIRNKDRPAMELYQHKPPKQVLTKNTKATPSTSTEAAPTKQVAETSKPSNSSTNPPRASTNNDNSSSKSNPVPKFKQRVFTRTRNA